MTRVAMHRSLALLFSVASALAQTERAVFAAGCFWSIELAYQRVPGVVKTSVVYAGGHTPNPRYGLVGTGKTGHAEAVEVEFDPAVTSFRKLVDLFWMLHDPTSLNKQGGDVGTQYRSAIYYFGDAQRRDIEDSRAALPDAARVVTEVGSATDAGFISVPAEDYHQQYLEKDGQDANFGSLKPIQCYGKRGPIKQMDKPGIKAILKKEL
jgi:methionine-S-sulfoxide reductase